MKKIAGKIAMLLILVMLGSMFVSCFTGWAVDLLKKDNAFLALIGVVCFIPCVGLDILTGIFQLAVKNKRSVYTAEDWASLTEEEYAFLTEKTAGLPEKDSSFLMTVIASMTGEGRTTALEQVNSIPEQQFASVVKIMRALYVLPQEDRILLVEEMRSLPESEKAYLTETASSLTDAEITALTDELSSIPAEEMERQIKVMRETSPLDWGYREYASERFIAR